MLTQIIGVIWILLGLWFLCRPQAFLKRLHKKGRKLMTRFLLAVYIIAAGSIISAALDVSGWWPKLIALVLLVLLFLLLLKVRRRFADQLKEKSELIQEKHIQRIAVGYIIIGAAMIGVPQAIRMTRRAGAQRPSAREQLDQEREDMEDW